MRGSANTGLLRYKGKLWLVAPKESWFSAFEPIIVVLLSLWSMSSWIVRMSWPRFKRWVVTA